MTTGYQLVIETSWIKLNTLQSYRRVRKLLVLGEYRSVHNLKITTAYDYEEAVTDSREFDPADTMNLGTWGSEATWGEAGAIWGGAGSSVYQFGWGLSRQKCESIKFRFEDIVSAGDTPGESYELTELTLEVGLKRTPFKLPPLKRTAA